LREIRRRGVPAKIQQFGSDLQRRLNASASAAGLAVTCEGVSVHPGLKFQLDDPNTERLVSTLFIQEMAKRGCHGYTSFYLNAAQGPAELDQTADAAREAFGLIAEGLDSGTLERLLECELHQESFRRLVR
jgi:glutamate-1-semialdehyde 2,1-aminomutase